jgi:prolyl 4-hydroxylase
LCLIEKLLGTIISYYLLNYILIILIQVVKGGFTAFPRLGIAIPPSKGAAVFWYNLKRSGRSDMAMLHGGCPVLLGSKWVANKWVREAANILHRKCIGHIDI